MIRSIPPLLLLAGCSAQAVPSVGYTHTGDLSDLDGRNAGAISVGVEFWPVREPGPYEGRPVVVVPEAAPEPPEEDETVIHGPWGSVRLETFLGSLGGLLVLLGVGGVMRVKKKKAAS